MRARDRNAGNNFSVGFAKKIFARWCDVSGEIVCNTLRAWDMRPLKTST